jgi:serine/threonine protein kinase
LIKSKPPADWWIVLADFGISKRIKESHGPSTVKGTYGFLAPELMGFIETTRSCRADLDFKACDMWAAGEVIVHMLTSKPRFEHMNQLLQYCSETKPLSLENSNLEAKEICEDLIDRLMTVSPGDRIIAMEAMEHDWFSSLRNSESGISIHLPIREQKATISNASDLASNAWTTRRSEWTSEAERPAHTSRRTANAVPAKSSKGLSGSSIMQRASMNAMRGTVIKGATGDALGERCVISLAVGRD